MLACYFMYRLNTYCLYSIDDYNSAIISISLMQPRSLSTCGVIRFFTLLKQCHSLSTLYNRNYKYKFTFLLHDLRKTGLRLD